jgi:hypothetical protein
VGFYAQSGAPREPGEERWCIARLDPTRAPEDPITWRVDLSGKPTTNPIMLDGDLVLGVGNRLLRWHRTTLVAGRARLDQAVELRTLPRRIPELVQADGEQFAARLVLHDEWIHLLAGPPPALLVDVESRTSPVFWFRFRRDDLSAAEETETFEIAMPHMARVGMERFVMHPVRPLPDGRHAVVGLTSADEEGSVAILDLLDQRLVALRRWTIDEGGRAFELHATPEPFPTRDPPGVVVYAPDSEGRLFEWYQPLPPP